jgi:hypothetical protein
MHFHHRLMPLLLLPLTAGPASAQPADAPRDRAQDELWRFSIIVENDGGIVSPLQDDRHYTSGQALVLTHQPDWTDQLADSFSLDYEQTGAGYVLAYELFTPDNITAPVPALDDRPYAAYAYGGVYWEGQRGNELDHVELTLGLVGPSARGEDIQTWIHSTFGGDEPEGWGFQLDDRVAGQVLYRRKWRFDMPGMPGADHGWGWQLMPQAGFTLGNVYRFAEAGLGGRVGYRLPNDFGPATIYDLPGATGLQSPAERGWSTYVYGRIVGRIVEHNSFIEDEPDNLDTRIDLETFTLRSQLGVAAGYDSATWSLSAYYGITFLSEEYEQQEDSDAYATLMLSLTARF